MDHEAGKVVASYPLQKPRDPGYNFLRSFQNAMHYKLARIFCSARVLRTHVDEIFTNGFLSAGSDVSHVTFSYYLAYPLYKKIDEIVMHPQWQNMFADFKLAKNTEFWYQDIRSVLKYLLQ